MAEIPAKPKIYHITHLRNLPQIVGAGKLWSDAKRIELSLQCDVVGMSNIKQRRLNEIEVNCHPGTHVGDYVPFYFCPRSIMLFILHKGNHPDLNYSEGQVPMVHLQADLHAVVEWAGKKQRPWAFSDRNAGTFIARFFDRLDHIHEVNWEAIAATDFRNIVIKEGKQAEFLVHESFPWDLVETIGVRGYSVRASVQQVIRDPAHRPVVSVKADWYY